MRPHTEQVSWLQHVLQLNSGFSLLSGMTLVVAATPLARVLTAQMTTVFGMALSTCLLVVGLGLITAFDVAWVLGSTLLLALGGEALTGTGTVIVVDLALVVAVFAGLEVLGLARSAGTPTTREPWEADLREQAHSSQYR